MSMVLWAKLLRSRLRISTRAALTSAGTGRIAGPTASGVVCGGSTGAWVAGGTDGPTGWAGAMTFAGATGLAGAPADAADFPAWAFAGPASAGLPASAAAATACPRSDTTGLLAHRSGRWSCHH
jgi:hypothetical protein